LSVAPILTFPHCDGRRDNVRCGGGCFFVAYGLNRARHLLELKT